MSKIPYNNKTFKEKITMSLNFPLNCTFIPLLNRGVNRVRNEKTRRILFFKHILVKNNSRYLQTIAFNLVYL